MFGFLVVITPAVLAAFTKIDVHTNAKKLKNKSIRRFARVAILQLFGIDSPLINAILKVSF